MAAEKRKPWVKWYWTDWRGDEALRTCSYAARGLWADMLALMHQGEPYGHLAIHGHPLNPKKLAASTGGSAREVERLVNELEGAGVFSRTDDSVIFSRRMVRDKAKDEQDARNGKRGGNPTLKAPDNGGVNPPIKAPDKAQRLEARGQKLEEERISPPSEARPSVEAPAIDVEDLQDLGPFRRIPTTPALDEVILLAVAAWNDLAEKVWGGKRLVQKLTAARRAKLRARLRDCGGIGGWREALEKLAASKMLTDGFTKANGDQWHGADFDFLLQEKSFTKLMEGSYDQQQPSDDPKRDNAEAIARAVGAKLESLRSNPGGDDSPGGGECQAGSPRPAAVG
ncbi:MAG: hypothetical protein NUV72_07170 [Bauldia sp.]|nr:hypothetical protein [Bauldia sp.]